MLYFAYASNLNLKQMAQRCPEAKAGVTATLPNYKIIFTGYQRGRGGASATIQYSKGNKVIGGIYKVNEAGLRKLDKYEDYPHVYKHLNVTVWTDSGEAVEAISYIKIQQEDEGQPSAAYKAVIQQGYRDWGIV